MKSAILVPFNLYHPFLVTSALNLHICELLKTSTAVFFEPCIVVLSLSLGYSNQRCGPQLKKYIGCGWAFFFWTNAF